MGPFSPRLPLLPFIPLSQTMAVPLSPTLVLGEASESDSEPEPGGNTAGTPAVGLKVPGEASETEEEEEEDSAARMPLPGVSRGAPHCCSSGWGRARGDCGAQWLRHWDAVSVGLRGCWKVWGGPWATPKLGQLRPRTACAWCAVTCALWLPP